jgi:soluble lytic murein transglycosylase-like protein
MYLRRILTPFIFLVAASCITVNVYPEPKAPLTFDDLEQAFPRWQAPAPDTTNYLRQPRFPNLRLAHLIRINASRAGIDPELLAAVIQHESGGDSLAINHDDPSYGLGQVMPLWWQYTFVEQCGAEATPETLLRADINVCYTAQILALAQARFGNQSSTLSYYNTGTPHRGIENGYVASVQQHITD